MRRMLVALVAISAAYAGGCARITDAERNSSETHFLARCDDGDSCGPGLQCMCGVCSVTCQDDQESPCGVFADTAACMPASASCGMSALCDVTCQSEAECEPLGAAYACSGGRCRAEPSGSVVVAGCPAGGCKTFDEPPCAAGSCERHGICYPQGTETEDGCCSCSAEGMTCIQPAWCGETARVGLSCVEDRDCDRGLQCNHDLSGDYGVCTRPCNHGCETGSQCVEFTGAGLDVCMLSCATHADCPAGTQCKGDLTGPRYCY